MSIAGIDVGTIGRQCPNCHQFLMHGIVEVRGTGQNQFVVCKWDCIRCGALLEIEKDEVRPSISTAGAA